MTEQLEVQLNTWLRLRLTASETALLSVEFPPFVSTGPQNPGHAVLQETVRQLQAYCAGELQDFQLPLDPAGTAFQRRVWTYLTTIPYGETRSYQQVAQAIGSPQAVRAVGAANGANPIAIVVPCHRVIGASGKLVGYGGGLELKRRLLDLEQGSLLIAAEPLEHGEHPS